MRTSILSALTLFATSQCLAATYNIRNNCPEPIELFVTGQSQGTLGTGATVSRSDLGNTGAPGSGTIYTSANGGIVGDEYSIVIAGQRPTTTTTLRQSDSRKFNTGVTVTPNTAPFDGFCTTSSCLDGNCTTAFRHPPVWKGPLPAPDAPAPTPPTYRCPVADTAFDVTALTYKVVPWPMEPPYSCKYIPRRFGAPLTTIGSYDCNDSDAQRWFLSYGATKVQLAGTNFCLDAGSNPGNGTSLKIWECFDNLAAQQWQFTDDRRLALEGTGLCLDLPSGNTANGNVLQTWACSDANANQVWNLPDTI
ncbi:G-X-X-X-Q-X-W domain-containing protein [Coprinopsis sp. MPI-PUGE-AT-0042]|nr:G-X-X-X-Q-X-W domain-containing protein [Coprinopsis sp. MPI-PUGE-AT-0042]